jgi:Flp pilus assembly pilin Flp
MLEASVYQTFVRDDRGNTTIEYAVLASAIALSLLVALARITPEISGVFTTVAYALGYSGEATLQ